MNRYSIIISVIYFMLSGISQNAIAENNSKVDKPSWINYAQRELKFPKNTFVIGFASEEMLDSEKSELMERVRNFSRSQLVESIQVTIKSLTTSQIVNLDQETTEYFKQTSVSFSKLNLTGLQTEEFFDEKEKTAYAISYAKKADLSKLYKSLIKSDVEKVNSLILNGLELAENDNTKEALNYFYDCYPVFREIEEAQTVIIALEGANSVASILSISELSKLKAEVDQNIQDLFENPQVTLNDICYFIAYGINLQKEKLDKPICILNFSYQDTKMGSELSKRLSAQLQKNLVDFGIKVVDKDKIAGFNDDLLNYYTLSGTYWEDDDYMKIIGIIWNPETGEAVISNEGRLPFMWFQKNNVKYKPDNYELAKQNQQKIYKEQIVSSGLNVDITTNKGTDNVIFIQDLDTMTFYVKANRACYIRFIYYLADGSKVLMYDNYHLDQENVNRFIEFPEKFEVAPPYGAEVLQVIAQTESFSPLNTTDFGGYKLINGNIDDVLASIRGFKPVQDNAGIAEKTILLTTLPRLTD